MADSTRVTITMPVDLHEAIRSTTGNVSGYIAQAATDKVVGAAYRAITDHTASYVDSSPLARGGIGLVAAMRPDPGDESAYPFPSPVVPGAVYRILTRTPEGVVRRHQWALVVGTPQGIAADPYNAPCVPCVMAGDLPVTVLTPRIADAEDAPGVAACHLPSSLYTPLLRKEPPALRLDEPAMARVRLGMRLAMGLADRAEPDDMEPRRDVAPPGEANTTLYRQGAEGV